MVARAILAEVKAGRGSPHGGVFLDIASRLPAEKIKAKLINNRVLSEPAVDQLSNEQVLDYIDWDGQAYFSQEDGNVIKGIPHNRFLVTVLQAMGLSPEDYEIEGAPGYGSTSTSGRDGNLWAIDYDLSQVGNILPGIDS